jgi:hypothetical protein
MSAVPVAESQRSFDVWYDDGTLVIRAENTLFRVYRGILSSHSEFFKDMLSLPQPRGVGDETVDDCHVVQVHDQAEDMAPFLRSLHDVKYVLNSLSSAASHAHLQLFRP